MFKLIETQQNQSGQAKLLGWEYGGLHNYQVHRIVFPLPTSLLPAPCSLLPAPCSLLPK
ncbi:MAG: hypothetical protein F6K63_05230 [Moorea sp. SIO1G6]|uniref:hypothetical protein n=1 Tax=Moorena sp. SIO1G6 TaxID=2607840 RepID=UPI0013BEE909|nr:hypothetical protein [Moorena sp. SIO1G6]NET63835.1 hypothetical protein [Moorena sp. SIO1G6]